jgi:hypothetical protein
MHYQKREQVNRVGHGHFKVYDEGGGQGESRGPWEAREKRHVRQIVSVVRAKTGQPIKHYG